MSNPLLSGEELHAVIEAATLAPSVHNTQPWRFTWDGRVLAVYEDPERSLPVLDPAGRERVLSCGAAVLNARLALRNLGHQVDVRLLPDPAQIQLLARLEVSEERADGDGDAELALAIARRFTDRGVFDERIVPPDVVQRLAAAAEQEGAWLRPVERQSEQIALAVLLSHADEVERSDPEYQAELARWRTHERGDEGVPDAAVAGGPTSRRGSDYTLRDFHLGEPTQDGPTDDGPPRAEHPLALILGTDHDEREDWVVAGMALGHVLLQATEEGLATSPMTQVVEIEPLRLRLRKELGLLGMPQVVLRVGFGHEGMATRRRPVEHVLQVL